MMLVRNIMKRRAQRDNEMKLKKEGHMNLGRKDRPINIKINDVFKNKN